MSVVEIKQQKNNRVLKSSIYQNISPELGKGQEHEHAEDHNKSLKEPVVSLAFPL